MGGSKEQTQTTESKPWAKAEPYYLDLYKKAESAFDQTNNKPYTGDFVAGPNNMQKDAVNSIFNSAPMLGFGADDVRNLARDTAQGKYLNANPHLAGVVETAMKPITEQYLQQILPSLKDKSKADGAYGGSRQDLQENQVATNFAREAADTSGKIYYEDYARERQLQQNAGSLLSQANALTMAPGQAMALAGNMQQGWDQSALQNEMMKHNESIKAPWYGLGEWANILSSGGYGTQTATSTQPSSGIGGALQGLIGGAGAGAGMATGIGGVAAGAGLGAFMPWMLPMAALGGLAGGFA